MSLRMHRNRLAGLLSESKTSIQSSHSIRLYISKVVFNLAFICFPFRPIFRKSEKIFWSEIIFRDIMTRIAHATEIFIRIATWHYKPIGRQIVGQLGKLTVGAWIESNWMSRLLNAAEKCYSGNKLQLLGVIWLAEYFNDYWY